MLVQPGQGSMKVFKSRVVIAFLLFGISCSWSDQGRDYSFRVPSSGGLKLKDLVIIENDTVGIVRGLAIDKNNYIIVTVHLFSLSNIPQGSSFVVEEIDSLKNKGVRINLSRAKDLIAKNDTLIGMVNLPKVDVINMDSVVYIDDYGYHLIDTFDNNKIKRAPTTE